MRSSKEQYLNEFLVNLNMKIIPVVRQAVLKEIDESYEDMQYWLSKTPQERIAAVTQLRSHCLTPGQRLDKTVVIKIKLHP
jgi:hypothetical protein